MNCLRQKDKPFRTIAAFVAAMVVLTLAGTTRPAQAQTYKDLHNFNRNNGDPVDSTGLIPQGRDGNLYGISLFGGTAGSGTVFKITPSGTPTILASLDSTTGDYPYCGLTLGTDGNFYGVTDQGGSFGAGSVYKITPAGTLTVLHQFTNGSDGGAPTCPPTQASNGSFYGVTTGLVNGTQGASTFYKVTSPGTFATLHTFTSSEGIHCSGQTLGSDGNFYGACELGGANNDGTLYKVSTGGHVTVLHSLTTTDGQLCQGTFPVQAKDGNYYGVCYEGGSTNNAGTVYQLKPDGAYKVLHNFTGGSDGGEPECLALGADGNLYGTASIGGSSSDGVIYKITTAGVFTVLHNFDGTHGSNPQSNLTLRTDGIFYGDTFNGGVYGDGVFFSLNLGFSPFVSLVTTSGEVGSKVGILGQGFKKTSVVKFGGVQATSFTLTGTTFILATVPAGAIDGKVTVTTGTTQLTSLQTFVVHNSWSSGAVLPTALQGPATGVIHGKVYVVGGATNSGSVAITQIYNPATNKWTTGASMPTPRFSTASGVVDNIMYVIGGSTDGSTPLSVVEAYDPSTNKWSTKASLPTATASPSAAVENGLIYVIGGYANGQRTAAVESYNPVTDSWTAEAPLAVAKSLPAVGLLGSTIVAAGGLANSGETGDNEGYSATNNSWSSLTADPTARSASCVASLSGRLIVAGGTNGTPLNVVESFNATADKWTTVLPLPQAVVAPGGAEVNGLLYCFGGSNNGIIREGTVYNYLQVYQP